MPHRGSTDEINRVKLAAQIEHVGWARALAAPQASVGLDITTQFVGNGAPLTARLFDASGRTFDTLKGRVLDGRCAFAVRVPAEARDALLAEVTLPDHGLAQDSEALLLAPPVELRDLRWSADEARRGDLITLSAGVFGAPEGTEATFIILEHDADGAHDLITRIPARVEGERAEAMWAFEYHDDTDDLPTDEEAEAGYSHPEYFFRLSVLGVEADSGLLRFKDWFEVQLHAPNGELYAQEAYRLELADGSVREGTLDAEGVAREEDIPPGPIALSFPDLDGNA